MGKRKRQLGQDKTCYIGRAILNKDSPNVGEEFLAKSQQHSAKYQQYSAKCRRYIDNLRNIVYRTRVTAYRYKSVKNLNKSVKVRGYLFVYWLRIMKNSEKIVKFS